MGYIDAAKSSGILDSRFLDDLVTSEKGKGLLAFYIHAIAYGGYQTGDIVNEMKRQELIFQGKGDQVSNLKIIDADKTRSDYYNSPEGIENLIGVKNNLSTYNLAGNLDPEILKYGINMPQKMFDILVPIQDTNSQVFKDAVAAIKDSYYERVAQSLQADTESKKAVADAQMEQFKTELEQKYGITLSNNAQTAWEQINTIEDTFSKAGISGSGMQNEEVDNYLKKTRKLDIQNRINKLSESDKKKAEYYTGSASSSEINGLTQEEKQKYGLLPSSDILAKLDLAKLKELFPDQTDSQLQAYRDTIVDENGNYRSTLYKNLESRIPELLAASIYPISWEYANCSFDLL